MELEHTNSDTIQVLISFMFLFRSRYLFTHEGLRGLKQYNNSQTRLVNLTRINNKTLVVRAFFQLFS